MNQHSQTQTPERRTTRGVWAPFLHNRRGSRCVLRTGCPASPCLFWTPSGSPGDSKHSKVRVRVPSSARSNVLNPNLLVRKLEFGEAETCRNLTDVQPAASRNSLPRFEGPKVLRSPRWGPSGLMLPSLGRAGGGGNGCSCPRPPHPCTGRNSRHQLLRKMK